MITLLYYRIGNNVTFSFYITPIGDFILCLKKNLNAPRPSSGHPPVRGNIVVWFNDIIIVHYYCLLIYVLYCLLFLLSLVARHGDQCSSKCIA